MLNTKDVVKLDNNVDYVVVSKLQYTDGNTYYYLLELDGTNVLICYERNDELVDVKDPELNSALIELFAKQEISKLTPEEKASLENFLKELNS